MVQNRDTQSLADFQKEAQQALSRLAITRAPLFLTVDGQTKAVIQDASAYEELLDRIEQAEIAIAVREGLEEVARGEGFELDQADEMMRRELGFPPGP